MLCFALRLAQLLKSSLTRDGLTQYENFIQMKSSIHSGIISVMLMNAMRVCVSIISCLVPILANASKLREWTAMYAGGKNQAIMLLYGLNWRTIKKVRNSNLSLYHSSH